MSILKLAPACKDYLWGGTKLITDYGKRYDGARLAETWELSGHPDGPSVLASGPDAGKTLAEYLAAHPGALGEHGRKFAELPVLIKLIDAAKDLSIQVHPDDAYARAHEGQNGKTEMWYVLSAELDAFLYCGFSRDISRDELARRIADNTLPEVLRRVNVKAGDTVFIPAGTIHAICAGILIAEIQQTSDLTYRIYDYDRPGPDGKPRELHTELAKEAIDYTVPDDYRTHYERIRNKDTELVACPYFTTHLCDATFSVLCDYSALDSFVVLIFVAGAGELVDSEGNRVAVRQGETVLIPASTRQVTLLPGHGGLRFLSSYIETPEE